MSAYVISYAIGPRKRPGMGFAYGSHRTLSTTAFQSVTEARRVIVTMFLARLGWAAAGRLQ